MTDMTVAPTRVPTHIPSLARAIDQMPPGHGGDDDLWDRLAAQEGTEEAMRLWRAACSHLDVETGSGDL